MLWLSQRSVVRSFDLSGSHSLQCDWDSLVCMRRFRLKGPYSLGIINIIYCAAMCNCSAIPFPQFECLGHRRQWSKWIWGHFCFKWRYFRFYCISSHSPPNENRQALHTKGERFFPQYSELNEKPFYWNLPPAPFVISQCNCDSSVYFSFTWNYSLWSYLAFFIRPQR